MTGDLNEPPPDRSDEIRLATKQDVPLISKMYRSEDIYYQRLEKGYQAVICVRGGEAVHMEWFCSRPYYIWDGRVIFDPGPGGCYLFDLYTRPDHRGRGLWRRAVREIIDYQVLQSRRPLLFSAVDYANGPAFRAHLKGGFTGLGLLEFKQVFGIRSWILHHTAASQRICKWGLAGMSIARLACRDGAIRLTKA